MPNLIVAAVFSAETFDTSGEILNIRNADISTLAESGTINTEHLSPKDAEKNTEESNSFKGFNTVVGRVLTAKKIFGPEDCAGELETQAWNELQVPLIWGTLEFYDDPSHPNASAVCSLIRNSLATGTSIVNISVEGNVLKRDGNMLTETVIRDLAATLRPCSKAAQIKAIVQDSPSEASKPNVITKASRDGSTFLSSLNGQSRMYIVPEETRLQTAFKKLKKALTAGGYNAAPSSLTGGSSLSTSSHLGKLEKLFGNKPISSESVEKALPKLPKEELEKVVYALKARRLKKNTEEFEQLYNKLFKA